MTKYDSTTKKFVIQHFFVNLKAKPKTQDLILMSGEVVLRVMVILVDNLPSERAVSDFISEKESSEVPS